MPRKVKKFNVYEHLDSPVVISAYLNSALQQDDPAFLCPLLGK